MSTIGDVGGAKVQTNSSKTAKIKTADITDVTDACFDFNSTDITDTCLETSQRVRGNNLEHSCSSKDSFSQLLFLGFQTQF